MRRFFLIATLNLIFQLGFSQSKYRFEHFDPPDGVDFPLAYSLVQDSLGFLWVHYNGGLVRYDGYDFKVYRYDPNDSVRSPGKLFDGRLLADRAGNVWTKNHQVNTPGQALILSKYDPKIDGFIKFRPQVEGANVHSICFDKNGPTIWLGTFPGRGLYRFNPVTRETKKYLNNHTDSEPDLTKGSPTEARNAILGISDRGRFLLLATWKGLWKFDKETGSFTRPKFSPADSALLYNFPVMDIYDTQLDDGKTFWLRVFGGATANWQALLKVREDSSVIQRFNFPEGFHLALTAQWSRMDFVNEQAFWISTPTNGLFRYDPNDSSFVNIRSTSGDPYSLRSDRLRGVTVDRDQNIWIATSDKWISRLSDQRVNFHHFNLGARLPQTTTSYAENGRDYILFGRSVSGLPGDNEIHIAEIIPERPDSLTFQRIKINGRIKGIVNYLWKGKKNLWIGTWADGVAGLPLNTAAGIIAPGPLRTFNHDPKNPNTISSNTTSGTWEDAAGNLWVGTYGGGLNKVVSGIPYGDRGSVLRYIHSDQDTNSISNNVIWWHFDREDEKSFWVRTASGIELFRNNRFEHVFRNEFAMSMNKTSEGTLFIGVFGARQGLYEAVKVGDQYQLKDNPLKSEGWKFLEDRQGRMWIPGKKLICYDRKEQTSIEFSHSYSPAECFQTSKGIMVFTDGDGITLLDPLSLRVNRQRIFPVLTRLTVNNKPSSVGTGESTNGEFSIDNDISILDELVLDYRHNNFTLQFSAMEMISPEKNLYRHKLEGYDNDWIETDWKNRTATYTNLDAGNYTFKVRASNHHGIWSDQETELAVVILPPPWKTWWAYAGYLMLAAVVLVVARRNIVQRERLKSNLKLEHLELEKAKEVDRVKSAFFTNISHEFRTPLTLIKGPVQDMLEEFSDHPKVKERMKLVQRNSDLLLRLINQLLDLAKLETGSLTVDKSEGDLNSFLAAVTNSFSSFALQKNITLATEFPSTRYLALFDKDKLETILINLINNAIKFTPAGGKVSIKASVDSDQLTLSVADTGIGIPEDAQHKIFERFHQVSEAHKEVGTGIGLALVKELVALLKGTVTVKSEPDKGSEFKVTLPITLIREVETEVNDTSVGQEKTISLLAVEKDPSLKITTNGLPDQDEKATKPFVLVVEDNSDLRSFIIGSLGNEFSFLEAGDGKRGLEIATSDIPDLIISDVMMPEMDGITMTGKIKHDIRTSHIPVILLTAKTSEDSKLSGLGTGADDYLTKPFNKNELLLKVRNRIASMAKIREKVKLELLKESPKIEVQSADEQFLQKVKEAILSRLSDEQLSVESLAEEIGLSRSQLFRKIVALTGVSVNELIRTFRLQKAAQLLEQNWGPVSQVAYEVGFSNLSYFSKMFKEQYGVLPSDYPVGEA